MMRMVRGREEADRSVLISLVTAQDDSRRVMAGRAVDAKEKNK